MRTLIRGATVLSLDEATGDLPRGDILIEGAIIAAVAPSLDVGPDVQVIEAAGLIAMPGFVNAHIHMWQSPLRGIAADWTLGEYVRAMHAGLAGFFTPDDIALATRVSAHDQIAAGTTTVADFCHNNPTPDHSDAAIDALAASGIRAVFLHGSPKPEPGQGQPHYSQVPMPAAEVRRLRIGRLASDDAMVTMGLAILGPQLSVAEVCEADFRLARELDLVAAMHVSGPFLAPGGFWPLAKAGLVGPRTNVVHGNVLDDAQLEMLVGQGVQFTSTPEVEMQMGFGNPLPARLRAYGGAISVGSDIESATTTDMATVARFALQAARHIENLRELAGGAPPQSLGIPVRLALEWATLGGARMLGLDHRIGSIRQGKQADIVLMTPGRWPQGVNPAAAVVLGGAGHAVDTVLVGGRLRKRGGSLIDRGADRDRSRLGDVAARIIGQAGSGAVGAGSR